MTKPACPACTLDDVLSHSDHWECATCGHEGPKEAAAEVARVVNHANGCIEDPRLHWLDGNLYLTTACRMFPPGPYWLNDQPTQCAPGWVTGDHPFGRAARENLSVTVLWRVDLPSLAARDYDHAFTYVTHLTDPDLGDNRDTFRLALFL